VTLTAHAPAPWASPLRAAAEVTVLSDTEARSRTPIGPDEPYLEGHYPDFAVLPGVFLLESVQAAVRHLVHRARGPAVAAELAAVRTIRFTAALRPGDVLDLRCEVTADGPGLLRVRAVCSAGTTEAARATLEFRLVPALTLAPAAAAAAAGAGARDPASAVAAAAVAAGSVPTGALGCGEVRAAIPHRYPMMLVDRVLETDGHRRAVTEKAVSGSEPCYAGLPDGADSRAYAYPPSLLMESWGQGGAFLWMQRLRAEGLPRTGGLVLAAVRDVVIERPVFPGAVLRHEVRVDRYLDAGLILSGTASSAGRTVATVGTAIAVMVPLDEVSTAGGVA